MEAPSKYIHEADNLKGWQKDAVESLNAMIRAAFAKPGKLVKVVAGYYMVVLDQELVELNRDDELSGPAKWVASEARNKWCSDPEMTLADLKRRVGLG